MKKKIIFLFIAVAISISIMSFASAASPVLYFSDLESGPKTGWEGSVSKGAAVSVWGNNFGSSRGSSYVTVNGVQLTQASDYAEWGVTGHENGVVMGSERITFWLNSNCSNGLGDITVTVNGVASNSLPFTVRTGNIYFASPSGSDNYNGRYATFQGSSNGPWRNLGKAKPSNSAFAPGDIVYLRQGNYTAEDGYGALLIFYGDSGEEGRPLAYAAYPGEKASLGDGTLEGFRDHDYRAEYFVISKFFMNVAVEAMGTYTSDTVNKSNWRVVGNDMTSTSSGWTGLIAFGASPKPVENFKILGNHIHDLAGDKYYHAMYMGTAYQCYQENNDIEIAWNELNDFRDTGTNDDAGGVSGIYIHPTDSESGPADNVKIHDNIIYNLPHAGIFVASRVKKVDIWNNIIYNCGNNSNPENNDYKRRPAVGLNVNPDTPNQMTFYNNVVYDNNVPNTDKLIIFAGILNLQMRNNIFYSRHSGFTQTAANVVSDHDIWYGDSVPSFAVNYISQDPRFVNPSLSDFHLQASSPAIDAGTSAVSAIVLKDFDGIVRPRGSAFDIGAYEYIIQNYHPADTNQNGMIEMRELIAFIARWKNSEVTVNDVIDALSRWFKGS